MILNSIYLENFRSFNSQGFTLSFSPNSNTIIGENNVGKTTIFEALRILLDLKGLNPEDFHKREITKKTIISIDCTLDEEQIKNVIFALNLPYTENEFIKYFSNKIVYSYEYNSGKVFLTLKIGFLYIGNMGGNFSVGYISEIDLNKSSVGIGWNNVIDGIIKDKSIHPKDIIEKEIPNFQKTNPNHQFTMNLPNEIHKNLITIISEKIITLEEYREKPQTKFERASVSRTGKNLVSILSQLKNGTTEPKKKYERIRDEFKTLFPGLDIESIIDNEEYKIQIQNKQIVSTTNFVGSGIIQTLFLITHVFAHPDKVLCIDEPEHHLHPHIQRALSELLFNKKDHQMIIVTHSPYFVNISSRSSIHRLIQENSETKVITLKNSFFDDKEYAKLDQVLDIDTRELFFARKVILVEGPSEIGALPIFAKHFEYDFNKHGVSLIFVDGKNGFRIFVKLCISCGIPFFIIADSNAEEEMRELIEEFPDVKSHYYLLSVEDFEKLFSGDLIEEAKKMFRRSKPRRGRYIAKKIIDSNLAVPDDIIKIFENLKKQPVSGSL